MYIDENSKELDRPIVSILKTALQIPGVKVDRDFFLRTMFSNKAGYVVESIVEKGPVEAGISKAEINKLARNLITNRTVKSSLVSFAAGIPGGLFLAASIPADLLQFYGVALRLAQEISYLYGEEDLWSGNQIIEEKMVNTLLVYYGVMLGISSAAASVRIVASHLGKKALNEIPKKGVLKSLKKVFMEKAAKYFGIKLTGKAVGKTTANIVAKTLPVIGGIISGAITFVSLKPMALRLVDTFEEAKFSYTEELLRTDLNQVLDFYKPQIKELIEKEKAESKDIVEEIKKAKELYEEGVLTQEEFIEIKKRWIAKVQ